MKKCPTCNQTIYGIMDSNYVLLYNTCWECDKKRWKNGELSLIEFEQREENALNYKSNEV
jgi:hypothetical protein